MVRKIDCYRLMVGHDSIMPNPARHRRWTAPIGTSVRSVWVGADLPVSVWQQQADGIDAVVICPRVCPEEQLARIGILAEALAGS
jgi:hypothetical protein